MKKEDIIAEQNKLRIDRVSNFSKIANLKKNYKLPIEVRIRKLETLGGFEIFSVDGLKIRHFIDLDFTMGGHGLRYVYVPLNEVWIDSSNLNEKREIIAHEIREFQLMKKGMSYSRAHEFASLVEQNMRNKKIILPVGHSYQKDWWSCGPHSVDVILKYYENKRSFDEIKKGTNPHCLPLKDVTLHKDMLAYFKKLGYRFYAKSGSKIKDIERFIQKGIPVIVDYQDYHHTPGAHFAVIIGYDSKRFLFSNSILKRKYEWIDKKKFNKDWYGEDIPGKIVKRWMLAVYRK